MVWLSLQVYNARSGEMVGLVDGNCAATHVLVFMVVGVTSDLQFSLGYFGTTTATAGHLFPLFWQAVHLLERACGLKVSICLKLLVISMKLTCSFMYQVIF